jgi:predicted RNase H-like nuclease (RuvC/YqgF family)
MSKEKFANMKIGHEEGKFIGKDGYVRVKIGGHWLYEHIYNWEQQNGPLPKNHFLKFKDKNKQNTSVENLVLREHKILENSDKLKDEIIDLNTRIFELEEENKKLELEIERLKKEKLND